MDEIFIIIERSHNGYSFSDDIVEIYDSLNKSKNHLFDLINDKTFDYNIDDENSRMYVQQYSDIHFGIYFIKKWKVL